MVDRNAGERPGIGRIFVANLVACGLVFLVLLAFAFVLALIEAGPEAAFDVLLVGGFYGLLFTAAAAVCVIAPLGTILVLVFLGLAGPARWLGAAMGGAIGFGFFALFLFGFAPPGVMDGAGDYLALALVVGVAALAGHTAQRIVLPRPGR